MIKAEYAFLLVEKLTGGLIPAKFMLFSFVGWLGLVVLKVMKGLGLEFLTAQTVATLCAMTLNYVLNNMITYRADRLRGFRFIAGYVVFCLVCSLGAIANIGVANLTITEFGNWALAGVAGAVVSSVFNFGVSPQFVCGRRRRSSTPVVVAGGAH